MGRLRVRRECINSAASTRRRRYLAAVEIEARLRERDAQRVAAAEEAVLYTAGARTMAAPLSTILRMLLINEDDLE
jgi:hypothetical protein